jgi:WD40 repeat protein
MPPPLPRQVLFSRDGHYLYSGARRDPAIHCWDVRGGGEALYTLERATADTNQRVQFDIDPSGRHLATGGGDGTVRVRAWGASLGLLALGSACSQD